MKGRRSDDASGTQAHGIRMKGTWPLTPVISVYIPGI
jgi:hypothetical protein